MLLTFIAASKKNATAVIIAPIMPPKKYAENSKVAVRNIRRDYVENVRKLQKNGDISEDQKHQDELSIQQITNEIINNIDEVFSNKEKEILDN